ncbi:hypothetical protein [Vibrio fluvialis]|uniref:hypothetical protein n=1 Tax=Vibrio fluvialis TaxID=676 RepID=UPI001C9BF846|nr:hypothetical protein [Vibrio fluvialis]MBY7970865.1 hypothetical protein [Vibrio fluvialis]MBY8196090.1 hypothetical protein [Vibrio fluvialis]MDT8866359.1 hypothetical protein [Vibrio fluvialis]MDT8874127.1 hypothetical protein [Vibrio fluvialis]
MSKQSQPENISLNGITSSNVVLIVSLWVLWVVVALLLLPLGFKHPLTMIGVTAITLMTPTIVEIIQKKANSWSKLNFSIGFIALVWSILMLPTKEALIVLDGMKLPMTFLDLLWAWVCSWSIWS